MMIKLLLSWLVLDNAHLSLPVSENAAMNLVARQIGLSRSAKLWKWFNEVKNQHEADAEKPIDYAKVVGTDDRARITSFKFPFDSHHSRLDELIQES